MRKGVNLVKSGKDTIPLLRILRINMSSDKEFKYVSISVIILGYVLVV